MKKIFAFLFVFVASTPGFTCSKNVPTTPVEPNSPESAPAPVQNQEQMGVATPPAGQ